MKAFLVLMAFALQAAAADTSTAAALRDIEGVYKTRFMNGVVAPGKQPMEQDTYYQAEDIVEIVRHDERHIYIRARLHFYNGHLCSIYGMARHEGVGFVFRDPDGANDGGERCTLTVTQTSDTITLTDRTSPTSEATCRSHCGMRGSLSGISMPKKSRRPIRYMDRLLNSRQYKEAAEQLRKVESKQVGQ